MIVFLVEFEETETVDTSHLSTERLGKEETGALFQQSLLLLGAEEHAKELAHIEMVVGYEVLKTIAKVRPEVAGHLAKFCPKHHEHPQSHLAKQPAQTHVGTKYFQETKNDEFHTMLFVDQKESLEQIAKMRPNDVQFQKDFNHIFKILPKEGESSQAKKAREAAEQRVLLTAEEVGIKIYDGDLLTVKMQLAVMALAAGSARAVDRFVFVGPSVMQMFHLLMNKTALDLKSAMPKMNNLSDEGSLGETSVLIGTSGWLSNDKKKIVRSGSYEKHSQLLQAWQEQLLGNALDHFLKSEIGGLAAVVNKSTALEFALRFLQHSGVCWYYNPNYVDPRAEVTCQKYNYGRNMLSRLVIGLAFKSCEKENDVLGLQALCRLSTTMFLNKSVHQTSKYAHFLCKGLVTKASASPRTQV